MEQRVKNPGQGVFRTFQMRSYKKSPRASLGERGVGGTILSNEKFK
jgi:hypothetical protein